MLRIWIFVALITGLCDVQAAAESSEGTAPAANRSQTLVDLVRSKIALEEQKIAQSTGELGSPTLTAVPPMKASPNATPQTLDKLDSELANPKIRFINVGGVGRMLQADLVFDGQIVYGATEGESYFGWRITSILPHKVLLEKSGKKTKRQTLELFLAKPNQFEMN